SNLIAAYDVMASDVGPSSPLTSVPTIPRLTANSNNNISGSWQTLIGSTNGSLSGFTATTPWGGTGTTSSPYNLSFGGSDSLSFSSVINTSPATTRFATSTWIKPSSPSTAGTVIA